MSGDRSAALAKLSAVIHELARRVVPDMRAAVMIIVTPAGSFVQGGGEMSDRELAQAVVEVARLLERDANPIFLPRGRA